MANGARPIPQALAPSRPASLRMELRALTAAAHERVDAVFSRMDLTDPAGYRRFLRAHYTVIPACEQALDAAGAGQLLDDWPDRVRAAALAADLAATGVDLPAIITPPGPLSPAAAFGMMYVLEGSRLGGAVLARRVLANPDPQCRAATHYLRHGEGSRLWPRFVAALDASLQTAADPEGVIAGARAAFALFECVGVDTTSRPN